MLDLGTFVGGALSLQGRKTGRHGIMATQWCKAWGETGFEAKLWSFEGHVLECWYSYLGYLDFWQCVSGTPFCCSLSAIRLSSWLFQSAEVRRLLRTFVKQIGLSVRISFLIRSLWRSFCCLSTIDDTWHRRWQANCVVNHSTNFMIKRDSDSKHCLTGWTDAFRF